MNRVPSGEKPGRISLGFVLNFYPLNTEKPIGGALTPKTKYVMFWYGCSKILLWLFYFHTTAQE